MKRTKKTGGKGFTLAELLIVLAILSILVAIAIPAFTAQLEKARIAVDLSNARSASSLAYTEYMLCHASDGEITYTFGVDDGGNLLILKHTDAEGSELEDVQPGANAAELKPNSSVLGETQLQVSVNDGRITENTWLAKLSE